ncbi:MAG: hypothetical protein ACYTJ0_16210 [Planctomycetota bacterium]|jgi:hypothetical protein
MAITTKVARHYAVRMTVIGALCVLFGVWGAWDLFVKIPREEEAHRQFTQLNAELAELEDLGAARLTAAQRQRYQEIQAELARFGGETPEAPSKFDRLVQVLAMSCILFAPYFFWTLAAARKRTFRLEDDGALVLSDRRWERDDIRDIDMSRWMAKSIAVVEHRDGRRVKLDDYVYQGADAVVGAIASRLHPAQWDEQARRIDGAAPPPQKDQAVAADDAPGD